MKNFKTLNVPTAYTYSNTHPQLKKHTNITEINR